MKPQLNCWLYSIILIFSTEAWAAEYSLVNNEILLYDTNNQQHAISKYIGHGQWTVVNIWGVDCPPCREEMPELVLLHDEYSTSLVAVLGIAIDFPSFGYPNKAEVIEFLQEAMADFPVLLSDETIATRLGAGALRGLPTTYLYTPSGERVAQQVGAISRETILDFIKKYEQNSRFRKIAK